MLHLPICGFSSFGRASPCQGEGGGFEPRNPLHKKAKTPKRCLCFFILRLTMALNPSEPKVRKGQAFRLCFSKVMPRGVKKTCLFATCGKLRRAYRNQFEFISDAHCTPLRRLCESCAPNGNLARISIFISLYTLQSSIYKKHHFCGAFIFSLYSILFVTLC